MASRQQLVRRFADNLRRILDAKNWTVRDLAARMNLAGYAVSEVAVFRWANPQDSRLPHSPSLAAMAEVLGVEMGDLYAGEAPSEEDDNEASAE